MLSQLPHKNHTRRVAQAAEGGADAIDREGEADEASSRRVVTHRQELKNMQ